MEMKFSVFSRENHFCHHEQAKQKGTPPTAGYGGNIAEITLNYLFTHYKLWIKR